MWQNLLLRLHEICNVCLRLAYLLISQSVEVHLLFSTVMILLWTRVQKCFPWVPASNYSGIYPEMELLRCMIICVYFLEKPDSVLWYNDVLNFDVVQFTYFFFCCQSFWLGVQKNPLPNPMPWSLSTIFFTLRFVFFGSCP